MTGPVREVARERPPFVLVKWHRFTDPSDMDQNPARRAYPGKQTAS
jgi:hypothetical protein